MNKEYIKAKLANLPEEPGSYQMKDVYGEIIYVGKAKNLHARVNQYFTGAHDFKTSKMVSDIEDFDFIVTRSEKEALVLEINLIKKHRPKYNIMFIDDSTYPYIKLTKEKYPRLVVARDTKKDKKAKYFGPFPNPSAAKETLKLLHQLYPFRRCTHMPNKVCLYYHMHQCLGPCEYDVDPSVYDEMIEQVTRFLNGDTKEISDQLRAKMFEASERMEYEKALEYKNTLIAIERVIDKQMIEVDRRGTKDAFAYYKDRGYLAIQGFLVRNGTVLSKEFRLQPLYGDAEDEFKAFLLQYYDTHPCAKELVIPFDMDVSDLEEILDTRIFQPQRGYRKQLIEMCLENAKQQLDLKFDVMEHQYEKTEQAMQQLNKFANAPFNRIELFDNSHISGTFTVAALVVYEDGVPVKKDYRKYKLHTGNSDIDSMKEVVYRRYSRLLKEDGRMPDGILVDGGWVQIEAAIQILDELGLKDRIKVMGLVKDDHHNTRGLMDEYGEEFDIPKDSNLFFLLTRMQDEVHNQAINFHRLLRRKAQTKSILDEVEGVGPKRKKALINAFNGFTGLKEASLEEIETVVPHDVAERVYRILHEDV